MDRTVRAWILRDLYDTELPFYSENTLSVIHIEKVSITHKLLFYMALSCPRRGRMV